MLSTLAPLACPIGMGLMMWLMMRGMNNSTGQAQGPADRSEVDALRAEVDALKADRAAALPQYRQP